MKLYKKVISSWHALKDMVPETKYDVYSSTVSSLNQDVRERLCLFVIAIIRRTATNMMISGESKNPELL